MGVLEVDKTTHQVKSVVPYVTEISVILLIFGFKKLLPADFPLALAET